jgi:hypothetical protein
MLSWQSFQIASSLSLSAAVDSPSCLSPIIPLHAGAYLHIAPLHSIDAPPHAFPNEGKVPFPQKQVVAASFGQMQF